MTILLATVPLMLVALAIATVPLLVAMGRERRERATAAPVTAGPSAIERERLPVAA